MAFVFPTSPTVGQKYTAFDKTWEWDGEAWRGGTLTAINAAQLGGLTANQFLRSDTTGTLNGALTVTGNLLVDDRIIHFGDTDTQIRFPAADTVSVETNGVERLRINSSGNVGIATNNPTFTLDVNGNFRATSITESSSITLKENVRPIEDSLSFIKKLNGVVYDRKDGSSKDEAGLIAEEVYKVLPNLVSLVNGAPEAIQYTKLTAYLIEAVKILEAEINELKRTK
jgi:hypothetical protein